MVEQVVYEMRLNDLLSGAVDSASTHVGRLEGALKSAKSALGVLGVGFAVFKGIEFVKDGVEAFHSLEQSVAQVKAGLESTKGAAGLTFQDVEESAKSLSKQLPYARKDIMDMQAQLLTFPAITKEVFDQTTQAVLDMGSRTHRGINEISIMIGKAMQDPERGITALRRVGVNFNEQQTEIIKKMVQTGHVAEAQKAILQELSLEFAGSAKAAADADPLFRYNKIMGSIKMTVGEAAVALLHSLTPALESFAKVLKGTIDFMREHWKLLKNIAIAVGTAWAAFKLIAGAKAIIAGIEFALQGMAASAMGATTATEGFSLALSINPLVAFATALGSLVFMFNQIADSADRANQARKDFATNDEQTLVMKTKDVYKKQGLGDDAAFKKAIEHRKSVLQAQLDETKRQLEATGGEAAAWKNTESAASKLLDRKADLESRLIGVGNSTNLIPKKSAAVVAGTGSVAAAGEMSKTKATGTKAVTINVTIQKLLGVENINTTNLKESAANIGKAITSTMMNAVNDFQIVAGE